MNRCGGAHLGAQEGAHQRAHNTKKYKEIKKGRLTPFFSHYSKNAK